MVSVRSMTLRGRLLTAAFGFIGVFCTLLALTCAAAEWYVVPVLRAELKDRTRETTRNLAARLDVAVGAADVGEIKRVLEAGTSSADLGDVLVRDSEGRVLYDKHHSLSALDLVHTTPDRVLELAGDYVAWDPIELEGVLLGTVVIGYSKARIHRLEWWLGTLVWVIVCSAVAAVLFSLRLSAAFVAPIRSIIDFSNHVARGNLEMRLTLTPPGELGELIQHLNAMAVALGDRARSLAEAREQALAASTAKSQFLANVSHEIRTPLNGVIGMTKIALEEGLVPPQREFVESAHACAVSLLEVINGVLDISKIEAGRMDVESIPFGLAQVLRDALTPGAINAQSKGLELDCFVDASVPRTMVGDPLRIRQILLNLVGNALKFTQQGSVSVRVRTQSLGGTWWLEIGVQDTGIGISPAQQERIFEVFTQADQTTTRQFGGTGLGLAISRRLAVLMNGDISVESEPGQGSTFVLRVPLQVEPQADLPPVLGIRKLVVVERQPKHLAGLQRFAAQLQLEAVWVSSTREAEGLVAELTEPGVALFCGDYDPSLQAALGAAPLLKCWRLDELTRRGEGRFERCLSQPLFLADFAAALAQQAAGVAAVTPRTLAEDALEVPPLRVLVAEDNTVNQMIIVRFLQKLGHTVKVVPDGRQAVEVSASDAPDLILMDVQMPVMDGLEATAAIRARERPGISRVPIVALTAHAMKGDEERCLAAGMDGHLTKPIERAALIATLARWAPRGGPLPGPEVAGTPR